MFANLAEWPRWLLALLAAPPCFCFGSFAAGWWPKNRRQWQLFGALLAAFTAVCVVAIGIFHHAA